VPQKVVDIRCVDMCDNPVSFPPQTSISAMVVASPAASSATGAVPHLDPPIQSLACGGQPYLSLPKSVLRGDESSSGSFMIDIVVDSDPSNSGINGVHHNFEYHSVRLLERELPLQKEIDGMTKEMADLRKQLDDAERSIREEGGKKQTASESIKTAEQTILQNRAQLKVKESKLEEAFNRIQHAGVNRVSDSHVPRGCAWTALSAELQRRRDTGNSTTLQPPSIGTVYGIPAELGRVEASDVANAIAQLLGGSMQSVYVEDEATIDHFCVPCLNRLGVRSFVLKAVTDKWQLRSQWTGPVDHSHPQRLLTLGSVAQWKQRQDTSWYQDDYDCLGYAVNLIRIDHCEPSMVELLRRKVFYPELRKALVFATKEGMLRYKHAATQQMDMISVCGARARSDGARVGLSGAPTGIKFRGAPANVPVAAILDPRVRCEQELRQTLERLQNQMSHAQGSCGEAQRQEQNSDANLHRLNGSKCTLVERIERLDTDTRNKIKDLKDLKSQRMSLDATAPPAKRKRLGS